VALRRREVRFTLTLLQITITQSQNVPPEQRPDPKTRQTKDQGKKPVLGPVNRPTSVAVDIVDGVSEMLQ
jgi:hypothetical protein